MLQPGTMHAFQAAVSSAASIPVTADVIPLVRRKLRLRIPGAIGPVRAVATEMSPKGAIIDCELGWLRLGEPLEVELAPDDLQQAIVRLIGVDVTSSPSHTAWLRVALDFARPDEAAFFAQASARPSDHQPYAGYEVGMQTRRRRRSHLWACLIGLVLGIGA